MTAPALLVLAGGARNDASALILHQLKLRLHEVRENLDCQVAFAGAGQPSITAAARALANQGHTEVVCVPLDSAHLASPVADVEIAVARVRAAVPEMSFELSAPVGAPGELFSLVDQRLHDALAAGSSREIDSLVLLHDGCDGSTDVNLMARRVRVWGVHHRLPVSVAGLHAGQSAQAAVAAHATGGRRHIAVGWLSVFDDAATRLALAAEPRVAAVGAPLGADDAVVGAILAQYSIAALRSLPFDVAQAS